MRTAEDIGYSKVDTPGEDFIERLKIGRGKSQAPASAGTTDNPARNLIGTP